MESKDEKIYDENGNKIIYPEQLDEDEDMFYYLDEYDNEDEEEIETIYNDDDLLSFENDKLLEEYLREYDGEVYVKDDEKLTPSLFDDLEDDVEREKDATDYLRATFNENGEYIDNSEKNIVTFVDEQPNLPGIDNYPDLQNQPELPFDEKEM